VKGVQEDRVKRAQKVVSGIELASPPSFVEEGVVGRRSWQPL